MLLLVFKDFIILQVLLIAVGVKKKKAKAVCFVFWLLNYWTPPPHRNQTAKRHPRNPKRLKKENLINFFTALFYFILTFPFYGF